MRVELVGTGSGDPLNAFMLLGNSAVTRGLPVWVNDPGALASGVGRFAIDVPNASSLDDALAVVTAFLDQIPGATTAFKIVRMND